MKDLVIGLNAAEVSKKMTFFSFLVCLLWVSGPVGQADTAIRGASAPYGMAGCGLGSVIIRDKDKNSQMLASVINTYFGFVTSSITTGTSNCNHHGPVARMEQSVYLQANLSSLQKEAVQGDGLYMAALAQLFGCSSERDVDAFVQFNRQNYREIYSEANPETVFGNLLSASQNEKDLLRACPGLS